MGYYVIGKWLPSTAPAKRSMQDAAQLGLHRIYSTV